MVQRAYIGVQIQNLTEELAEEIGVTDLEGIYVNKLMDNGSAEDAGIKEGDIIKEVEGIVVSSATELQAKVGEFRPGDKITVVLIRQGKELTKIVTLKNMEGNTSIIKESDNQLMKTLGAKFNDVNKELKLELKLEGGAQVESIFQGKFKNANISEGFIITRVDKVEVKDVDQLLEILSEKKNEGVLLQGIYPNGRNAYYGVGL
jgi:S1-C subfamily serine protease